MTQSRINTFFHPISRSSSSPTPVPPLSSTHSTVVVRALSDISNSERAKRQANHQKKKAFYDSTRARFAHPNNNAMCARCGVREHCHLHHERRFSRTGTNIRAPSSMTPPVLAGEIRRCTKSDGTVGLISLCNTCHREAHRRRRAQTKPQPSRVRNIAADDAAKLQRGKCECDGQCGRAVTTENVREFEWDHLVQSFDDPDYQVVNTLVVSGYPLERCERERNKCRLLYHACHRSHSAVQHQRRCRERYVNC